MGAMAEKKFKKQKELAAKRLKAHQVSVEAKKKEMIKKQEIRQKKRHEVSIKNLHKLVGKVVGSIKHSTKHTVKTWNHKHAERVHKREVAYKSRSKKVSSKIKTIGKKKVMK